MPAVVVVVADVAAAAAEVGRAAAVALAAADAHLHSAARAAEAARVRLSGPLNAQLSDLLNVQRNGPPIGRRTDRQDDPLLRVAAARRHSARVAIVRRNCLPIVPATVAWEEAA